MMIGTKDVLGTPANILVGMADQNVRKDFSLFMAEFNKREWSVRIGKTAESFDDYVENHYIHKPEYGTGFVVDNKAVPYFHPNRSFHDEIIWLNENLYYDPGVSFIDKIVNSAIVKFYGPSRTLGIISGHADDLPYLTKTPWPYINVAEGFLEPDYVKTMMDNIDKAALNKEQLWGTTELRTSLQTAARQHSRWVHNDPERKFVPSDMIQWILSMVTAKKDINGVSHRGLAEFYKSNPTMQQSYDFLTARRGIGAYYGYHFSSNLARMPGVGAPALIEREFPDKFASLKILHGKLDENDDYVVAGPGATNTLQRLWPNIPMNQHTTMALINAIKQDQLGFFGINTQEDERNFRESSELGQFTTFGVEISCCQYSVFNRLKDDRSMAAKRALAPISKEVSKVKTTTLEGFFE